MKPRDCPQIIRFHLQLQRHDHQRALFVIWSSGEDGHISKSRAEYQPVKGSKMDTKCHISLSGSQKHFLRTNL